MTSSPSDADRSRRRLAFFSGALFLATSGLLLLQAGDPLWLDELHTVWCARGPLGEVRSRAALGNQSPLFFLIEALVGRLLSYGPYAMRAVSVFAAAAAVVTLFRFVARSSGSLTLGAMIACAPLLWPTLTFYFVEARPYATVYLAASILWTKLAEALEPIAPEVAKDAEDVDPRVALLRMRFAWVAALAAAIWLHPTALLLFVPTTVALAVDLVRKESRKRYSARARGLDLILAAVISVPAIPLWRTLFERRGAWNAFIRSPGFADWDRDFQLWAFVATPVLAAVAALVVHALFQGQTPTNVPRKRPALRARIFFFAFALPVLVASVATWTDLARVYHFRYLIGAVAALPLFAASSIEAYAPHRLRSLATGAFVAGVLFLSGGATALFTEGRIVPRSRQENWHGLAERMSQAPAGPIVLDGDVIESKRWHDSDRPEEREYLAFPLRAFATLADRDVQSISYESRDPVELRPEIVQQAEQEGRLYAVIRGGAAAPQKMERRLRDELPEGFDDEPTIEPFGRVWLLTYECEAWLR